MKCYYSFRALMLISILALTTTNILLTLKLLKSWDTGRSCARLLQSWESDAPENHGQLESSIIDQIFLHFDIHNEHQKAAFGSKMNYLHGKSPGVLEALGNERRLHANEQSITTTKVHRSTQKSSQSDASRGDLTQDKQLDIRLNLGRFDKLKKYKIHEFVVIGDNYEEASKANKVSLATQSSVDRLHWLPKVMEHWTGPMSLSIFVPDVEYSIAKVYVAYLRQCFPAIRQNVSIHLVYPILHPPKEVPMDQFLKGPYPDVSGSNLTEPICTIPGSLLKNLLKSRSHQVMRWRQKLAYPQNHLRNIARKTCQTKFVFVTDIDIIPSWGATEKLNTFLQLPPCQKCVFVVPTYELDENQSFPRTKRMMIRLAKQKKAQPFHAKVFIHNQYATNYSEWVKSEKEGKVQISHKVSNMEFFYEPFYIATDEVPEHHEGFMGYGFTRNTQVYETYVAGYDFFVLTPVFTVHWGLSVGKKGRPAWREQQNNVNRRVFENYKKQIFVRYGKDPLKLVTGQKSTPVTKKKRIKAKS